MTVSSVSASDSAPAAGEGVAGSDSVVPAATPRERPSMAEPHQGQTTANDPSRDGREGGTVRALALGALGGQGVRVLVPIDAVAELAMCESITPAPLTRHWVRGLAEIGGRLFTVVDLSAFLGGPRTRPSRDARVIVLGERCPGVCLLVGGVSGMKTFDSGRLGPLDPGLDDDFTVLFHGTVDIEGETCALLDVAALVCDPRFRNPARVAPPAPAGAAV